ncbi:MAG TPA: hypothetical protein VF109_01140 [Mycobacteriales bacterium]
MSAASGRPPAAPHPARPGDPAAALAAAREPAPRLAERAAGTSASRRGWPLERIFRDARRGSPQPAPSDVRADRLGTAGPGPDPESAGGGPRW